MKKLWIMLSFAFLSIYIGSVAVPYSWPTPANTPFPFFPSVTAQPTPPAALSQIFLCFQDYTLTQGVVCGRNVTIPQGDSLLVGISIGSPNPVTGQPQGPFPATITETVNGTIYSNIPVNASTGFIGWATVPGSQILTVSILGSPTLLGTVQTVSTQ